MSEHLAAVKNSYCFLTHENNPGHAAPVLDGNKIFSMVFKVASRGNGLRPRKTPLPAGNAKMPNGIYLMRLPVPPAPPGIK